MSNGHRPSQRSQYRLRYDLDLPGFEFWQREKIYFFSKSPYRPWDPFSLPFNGYWGSFPRLKQPGHDVDHSTPSSADVKNKWIYTSHPLYAFMVWAGATLPAPFLVLAKRSFLDVSIKILYAYLITTFSVTCRTHLSSLTRSSS